MANLADLLPTPAQTLVSTSYWANPYIEEARQFLPIILTPILIIGFIVLIQKAFFRAGHMIEDKARSHKRDHLDDKFT